MNRHCSGRRALSVWLAVCGSMALALSASAQQSVVLVDHSGSMKGFDQTGALRQVIGVLQEQLHAAVVRRVVSRPGESTELLPEEPLPRYGAETRIYQTVRRALETYPSTGSLWLITDNVPSHSGADRDLDAFYSWLRNDKAPIAVTLFVLKLPFAGAIYATDGHTALTRNYRGDRAVVMYAILLDKERHQEFDQAVGQVSAKLGETRPGQSMKLRVKPLQLNTVHMEFAGGTMRKEGHYLVGHGVEGKPFEGTFRIQLQAETKSIHFKNVRPRFGTSEKFTTVDFYTKSVEPHIERKTIDEISDDPVSLDAVLRLEPVRVKRTIGGAMKAFAKGKKPGVLEGYLTLLLDVDRRSVVINPSNVESFSTDRYDDPSEDVQSKIYRLQDLFREKFVDDTLTLRPTVQGQKILLEEDPSKVAGRIPVRIEMAYSPISAVILVGSILVPALLLLALCLTLWRFWNVRYELSGDVRSDRPFRVGLSRPIRGEDGILGSLHRFPPMFWFTPNSGWNREDGTGPQRLGGHGGTVHLKRKSDETTVRFDVKRVGASGGSGSSGYHRQSAEAEADSDPFGRIENP